MTAWPSDAQHSLIHQRRPIQVKPLFEAHETHLFHGPRSEKAPKIPMVSSHKMIAVPARRTTKSTIVSSQEKGVNLMLLTLTNPPLNRRKLVEIRIWKKAEMLNGMLSNVRNALCREETSGLA
jgi:hypothetical protein